MNYRVPKWFLPSMILGLVSYDVHAKSSAVNDSPSLKSCFSWFGKNSSSDDMTCMDLINYHYDKVVDAKLGVKGNRLDYQQEEYGISSFEERALKTRIGSAIDR